MAACAGSMGSIGKLLFQMPDDTYMFCICTCSVDSYHHRHVTPYVYTYIYICMHVYHVCLYAHAYYGVDSDVVVNPKPDYRH